VLARSTIAIVSAALCLALFALVLANVTPISSLVGLGNILGANTESQVTTQDARELLSHVQMLLLGAAALAVASVAEEGARLLRSRRSRLARTVSESLPFVPVIAVALPFAAFLVLQRSHVVDGRRFYFLLDDAMNSMRYAQNFAQGHGLVYNVGERVEGYTNFLWVVVMAAVHRLGAGPQLAPLWILILSWISVAFTVGLVVDALRALDVPPSWALLAGLLALCDQNTMTWADSGLETSALTFAVTACAWALVRGKAWVFGAALVGVALLRADGFVVATALGAASLRPSKGAWKSGRALLPAACLAAGHFVFRRLYYGYWFPNTYYLKMIDLHDRLRIGFGGYGFRIAIHYPLFLALAATCACLRRTPSSLRALSLVVFAQAGYAIYLGGDIFGHLRFVAPVIPLLYLSAVFALFALVGDSSRALGRLAQGLALVGCPVLHASGKLGSSPESDAYFAYSLASAGFLERNVPDGSLVSVYAAGTVPYYAPRLRYVDVFGKNDEHIAHMTHYAGLAIGHNKFDFDYLYNERKPDVAVIFASCPTIDEFVRADAAGRRKMRDRVPFLRQVPLFDVGNATFERDYYPNRVRGIEALAADPIDCVFVRKDSAIPVVWSESGAPPLTRGL
jgi:hypothetical protein